MKPHKSERCNVCIRCKGLVVKDYVSFFCIWIQQLRCLNCGWIKLEDLK